MSLQRGINLRSLAEKTGQCSGAEVRGICTEAGMYALRERRQHVTQEDFEFAIAKVRRLTLLGVLHSDNSVLLIGVEEESGRQYIRQQAILIIEPVVYPCTLSLSHSLVSPVKAVEMTLIQNINGLTHVATITSLEQPRHTLPRSATLF